YHGDTIGSVSLGGIPLFHQSYSPLLFPTYRSEAPYCYRCHLGLRFPSCRLACGDDVEKTIRKQRDELAAVIVEPLVQGAAGMLIWPRGYLKKISEICKKNQVLLILDEVFTGFGRTGKMFACQHEGIQPDLMALSKGLTGGYMPLAATLTSLEVYEAFLGRYDEFKTFFHGHSFTGNQLGCALALANLKLFKREGILRKTARRSRVLAQSLAPLKNHSKVGDIRQVGLIAAVEMVKDKATGEAFHLEDRIGHRIAREAQDRGMIIRPLGNVVSLIPPLSATEAQIRKMGRIVCDSIRAVCPEE
ncbi:MAG TPA: aminotransferase class III-fold pyridoxal phosphate-dependent enzyme, partial [Nitrospiria bacterium]|nr:aminotransferase class III-fold pyridoxal phosphate-dependent enzyme [Nitrospiria bacterium]